MNKHIEYGTEVRKKIVAGAKFLEEAVISTYGPEGHNVIIDNGGYEPVYSKDGATVANAVDSDDPFLKIGIALVKGVVSKVDAQAGDGTTTTTLYTTELLESLANLANLGVNANDLRSGMNKATQEAIELLKKYAEKTDNIEAIAKVASNNNPEITRALVDAFNSIGDNGSIILADSWKKSGETYVETSKGIEWKGGIPSPLFITNPVSESAELDSPYIMVLATGVKKLDLAMPYARAAQADNKTLVIIAPYFEPELYSVAAANGIVLVMSPGSSFSHLDLHEALMDLAITVGTKVIPDLENAIKTCPEIKDLGVAKHITVKVDETKITQVDELSETQAEAYFNYIENLKSKLDDDNELTPTVQEAFKERLARLSGGIATIYIGAPTPAEREEKYALYQDAQNSISSALKYGVLPGGGTALLKVAQELSEKEHKFESEAEKRGYFAVLDTLRKPAKVLVKSVKPDDYQYLVQEVAHKENFWTGYNVRTQRIEDLKKSEVMDSAAIEMFALKYAASAIGAFIISDGVIVNANNNVTHDYNSRKFKEAFNA